MTTERCRIVFTGYLVRFPLGGYAWQVAHYLLGFRALGHDVWFYEDTGYYTLAYNPVTDECHSTYDYGITMAASFFDRLGFGEQWVFTDVDRGMAYGPGAGRVETLMRDADLLVNLGGVNRILPERRGGRPAVYIDLDPAYTQIKLVSGDTVLRTFLNEHTSLFTFGENIGTARSTVPTGGFTWHPTRQPVVLELWSHTGAPGRAYTTVGTWTSRGRDLTYQEEKYQWSKRAEWLRCLDLPERTTVPFEMAMDVDSMAGDLDLLTAHGWRVINPLAVSTDPWRYHAYIRESRGEFSVAKDINVRLRSGWFSDRAACYLAAGRPVVGQDTGFGDILPLGPGLHAFCTVEDAADAVRRIEADYHCASAQATAVAWEYFAAEKVLERLLRDAGL